MNNLKGILTSDISKKTMFLLLLISLFLVTKKIFGIFFMTFIFIYLVDNIVCFITSKLPEKVNIKRKYIAMTVYVLFFMSLATLVVVYFPIALREGKDIVQKVSTYSYNANDFIFPETAPIIEKFIKEQGIDEIKQQFIEKSFEFLKKAGKIGIEIFISLILSIFFLLEKEKIHSFIKRFEKSEISGVYKFFEGFWTSFLNSFGKIMKAQVIIAIANTILSLIGLYILGFPGLAALGIMILGLSLIPVAGVIISMIPLSLIAMSIGGITKVLALLIMILIIHAIESYLLNPKIMSEETDLPIFITFLVLIISEYFMGVLGLMIGLPLFIFLTEFVNPSKKSQSEKLSKGTSFK